MTYLDFDPSYHALKSEWGVYLTDDVAVRLSGSDVRGWLQGQVTNDVRKLSPSTPVATCLCSPTGQLLGAGVLFDAMGAICAVFDRVGADALMDRVARNVILEDVTAKRIDARVVTVQGPGSLLAPGFGDVELGAHNRLGTDGRDFLATIIEEFPVTLDPRAIEVVRVEAGRPKLGQDSHEKTLPPELGPWFDQQHVSHQKGCYTGQEVLHRIFSRGRTNRTLCGLRLTGPSEIGASISLVDKEVGTLTSLVESPEFGLIGLAVLRNEAAEAGTLVRIAGHDATIVALPFVAPS